MKIQEPDQTLRYDRKLMHSCDYFLEILFKVLPSRLQKFGILDESFSWQLVFMQRQFFLQRGVKFSKALVSVRNLQIK